MKALAAAKRLKAGPVFLRQKFEGAVLRSTPEGKYFARFPGDKEYEIHSSTDFVEDAVLDWVEITKSQYTNF